MDINEVGTIWIGNSHVLAFEDVVDESGDPLNDGTATFELAAVSDGSVVTSGDVPVLVAGTNNYGVLIDKGSLVTLVPRVVYNLTVEFDKDGRYATYRQKYQARYRT